MGAGSALVEHISAPHGVVHYIPKDVSERICQLQYLVPATHIRRPRRHPGWWLAPIAIAALGAWAVVGLLGSSTDTSAPPGSVQDAPEAQITSPGPNEKAPSESSSPTPVPSVSEQVVVPPAPPIPERVVVPPPELVPSPPDTTATPPMLPPAPEPVIRPAPELVAPPAHPAAPPMVPPAAEPPQAPVAEQIVVPPVPPVPEPVMPPDPPVTEPVIGPPAVPATPLPLPRAPAPEPEASPSLKPPAPSPERIERPSTLRGTVPPVTRPQPRPEPSQRTPAPSRVQPRSEQTAPPPQQRPSFEMPDFLRPAR